MQFFFQNFNILVLNIIQYNKILNLFYFINNMIEKFKHKKRMNYWKFIMLLH